MSGVLEKSWFWLTLSVVALTGLVVALIWTWAPTGRPEFDTLWQFALQIFLGGFFTATLTYAAVVHQSQREQENQQQQEQNEHDRRQREFETTSQLQVQQLERNYQLNLAREVKVGLYQDVLNYAIELAYRDESIEDVRKIERQMYSLQVFSSPAVMAAAQRMIGAMVATNQGVGKGLIEDFAASCHEDLYRSDQASAKSAAQPESLKDFLWVIQKRVLGVSGPICYVRLGDTAGFRKDWFDLRASDFARFKIAESGDLVADGSYGAAPSDGDTIVFWNSYRGTQRPGILGTATVGDVSADYRLPRLAWKASIDKLDQVRFNTTEAGLPSPPRTLIASEDVNPSHVQELQNWIERMLGASEQSARRLNDVALQGWAFYGFFRFDLAYQTERAVADLANAIVGSFAGKEEVLVAFPERNQIVQLPRPLPGQQPLVGFSQDSKGAQYFFLIAGEHGRDSDLMKFARSKRDWILTANWDNGQPLRVTFRSHAPSVSIPEPPADSAEVGAPVSPASS
jgi:hypothetical protein